MEQIKCYDQNSKYVGVFDREGKDAEKYWCDVVIALIVNFKTKKIYLQVDAENKLQLTVGGHVQYNEDVYDAINREMMEESGIKFLSCDLMDEFCYRSYEKKQIQYYFICTADISLKSFNIVDKNEVANYVEFDLDEFMGLGCGQRSFDVFYSDGTTGCITYSNILNAFNGNYVLNRILDVLACKKI